MKINNADGTRIEVRIQGYVCKFVRVAGAWEDAQARVRTEVEADTVSNRISTALCMGGEIRITHE